MITPKLHKAILYVVIVFLFLFLYFQSDGYEKEEILRQQNDSIIVSLKNQSETKDSLYVHRINRLIEANKYLKKSDSINHYKYNYAKRIICTLSRNDRNILRDSIFRANGL